MVRESPSECGYPVSDCPGATPPDSPTRPDSPPGSVSGEEVWRTLRYAEEAGFVGWPVLERAEDWLPVPRTAWIVHGFRDGPSGNWTDPLRRISCKIVFDPLHLRPELAGEDVRFYCVWRIAGQELSGIHIGIGRACWHAVATLTPGGLDSWPCPTHWCRCRTLAEAFETYIRGLASHGQASPFPRVHVWRYLD